METESIKIEVSASATPQDPSSLGVSSTVVISRSRQVEEFIVNESDDGRISSLGSYQDSSFHNKLIILRLQDFRPNLVYQHVHEKLHDRVLSRLVTDKIVVESQRRDLPQQGPLLMTVSLKVTHKEYIVVPCISAPSSTVESDTCAICLENMSESEPLSQPPNCVHRFHEDCFIKWLDRQDSCPLCRKLPNTSTNKQSKA